MTTPFREAPLILACPRCGENLNEVTGDVSMCAQCGGVWLAQPAVVTAFQDPTWPHGVSMWWRRELACPVCAGRGTDETMASVYVDDLLIEAEARKLREQADRVELTKEREELAQQIDAITAHLVTMREAIASDELRLREMRSRLRMIQNQLSQLGS